MLSVTSAFLLRSEMKVWPTIYALRYEVQHFLKTTDPCDKVNSDALAKQAHAIKWHSLMVMLILLLFWKLMTDESCWLIQYENEHESITKGSVRV